VNFFHTTVFGFTAWRVCLAAGLLVLYVVLRIRWYRAAAKQRRELKNSTHAEPKLQAPRSWKEKPPVDLTDTQRIDHLHRHILLKAGEHADLKELTFGRLPRLRVSFAGIEHESGQEYARIKVELGGATADCGKSVQELGENDFLVPRATHDEQHCSIHYTCGKSDAVSFLQVKVSKFDALAQSAAIDVLHVRGRRAA